MAKFRIQSLEVEGFRGILKPRTLPLDGKSLLLFGENGSGKSSFLDALERLFTGQVSTLDGRAQGLSSEKNGPHIKLVKDKPRISVTFNDASATKVELDTATGALGTVTSYLEPAREPVYILRRSQVLAFVEAVPRSRYELLTPFFPLSSVEQIEVAFKTCRDQLETQFSRSVEDVARVQRDFHRLLGMTSQTVNLSEELVLTVVNERLKTSSRPLLKALGEVKPMIERLDEELAQFGDLSRHSELTISISALDELRTTILAVDVDTFLETFAELKRREEKEARVFYEKVLEEGARWIEEEGRTDCPLCEQELRRFPPSEVVARARARLEEMRELISLRKKANEMRQSLLDSLRSCLQAADKAGGRLPKLAEEVRTECNQMIGAIVQEAKELSILLPKTLSETYPERVSNVAGAFRKDGVLTISIDKCVGILQSLLAALPSARTAQDLLSLRGLLAQVIPTWTELKKLIDSSANAGAAHQLAQSACEALEQARKETVGSLYKNISQDIDNIYRKLHKYHEPEEPAQPGQRNVRLEIREAVAKSVNLKADFYDQVDVDPRAYYSEAHLDSLGISIFLALRKWYRKQHPDFDLLVLDDVLTSIDATHAVNLTELLLTEFSDYQILLTTHDRIWFEQFRDIQSRCGVAQNFINKVIHKWTVDDGPDIREPADERSQLEKYIQTGQAPEIAALAGRLLEHILQEMRYSLRLRIPAKPGEVYEIGDLWPPFYREVKKNYSGLYSQGQSVFDTLNLVWPLRNWVGAHFNAWAKNVPRDSAVEFGNAVEGLFDLLFCATCRRFVSPSVTPLGQIACPRGEKIYAALGKKPTVVSDREKIVAETAGVLRDAKLTTTVHLEWKRTERSRES